ncbi:glycine cleavage system protein GcvH [Clostridioides difficile]|nr:glycine cleavage system protein GcvH [Clostridioides difficile]MDI3004293.1 glycine cleavage system protein GcvH [Clostridioides difficile]
MSKLFAILPCNGIDKCVGCITREIALDLKEKTNSEILCPTFYRVSDTKYNKILEDRDLIIIDGCNTKCSTKLASEKNLKIAKKINVAQVAKEQIIEIGKDLRLGENEIKLKEIIIKELLNEIKKADSLASNQSDVEEFNISFDYQTYKKDKFTFKLAMNKNLYFNENDAWAYIDGSVATIGVTDYVQQSLGDIMFFETPQIGEDIDQFGELGAVESSKTALEIVSPVSGKVIAINTELEEFPEYINENPYEKGWLVKIELFDFEEDKDLLINDKAYFEILKRKVDDFHVKN